jgi:hypothetical protein
VFGESILKKIISKKKHWNQNSKVIAEIIEHMEAAE